MVGRTIAAVAVSATVAPAAFLPPPLYSAAPSKPHVSVESRFISQVGLGGLRLYSENCAICHGDKAVGSEYGPALSNREYWEENLPREAFHATLTSPGHAGMRGNAQGEPLRDLGFNKIELIARYVHEIQRPDLFR